MGGGGGSERVERMGSRFAQEHLLGHRLGGRGTECPRFFANSEYSSNSEVLK